jgi:hypothetical protein
MAETDQSAFTEDLLSLDQLMPGEASRVEEAASAGDWLAASPAAHALPN